MRPDERKHAIPNTRSSANVPRVLMVDDEMTILRFLRSALDNGEFSLNQAENGRDALAAATAFRPDLILLDLGLPDMDGVDVIRKVREWSQVPIIVISVRDTDDDKVAALDAGADDYLVKPFSIAELQARIRVSLRRSTSQASEPIFSCCGLEVDLAQRRVVVRGKEVQLTPTEYDLLRLLVNHAGKVLTHDQILKGVWGAAYAEHQNVLRVNVSNLRQKIEEDPSRPKHIVTELGIGYRLKDR
jgi:two-component system, OmpR family, KDP operon response regulator KdpE